ncbi:MAG: nuclear transport factor 2 family protein, partial [Mycobacterium sp.]|uniref:nuclear transport factor 2 family protein n=1 Tax=Mycobacterium sp. TaxID=1785 RepID=UPI001EC3684A
MTKTVATKNENEKIVIDFIHAAYGERMDVDAMTSLMTEDFVWQLHVPLSPIVRGRDAARAELEKHSKLSTGMVEGSEIRTIVSDGDTVVVERVDVNAMNGVTVTFYVTAFFGVRDGKITGWREYWDAAHV